MRCLRLGPWQEAVGWIVSYHKASDAVDLDIRSRTVRVPLVNVRERDAEYLRAALGERVAILNVPQDESWRARPLNQTEE